MRMNTDREQSEQQTKQSRWGFRGMTVRDWLQLLIVPLALVVIGFLFTMQQDARQQQIEDQRAQQAQKIENQRAEAERALAVQRAQDEALQAYLDQMGNLLLERDLRDSDEDSEVQTLARARTATVIQRLDSDRNISVIGFLYEAGLIQTSDQVRLLTGANLQGAHLQGIDLIEADLSGSNLSGAVLFKANVHNSDLSNADLGSRVAPRSVFHGRTYLKRANLKSAILSGTDLRNAIMSGTDLSGAYLADANLSGAKVPNKQLGQATLTIEGATMPNGDTVPTGKKYEDWEKDFCRHY